MTRANSLAIFALSLSSVLFLGCSSKTSATDSQITTDIQAKLYSDPATKQSNVVVAVKDGAVTLTGDVPNSDVALAAMKIANSSAGVHEVADQMKITTAVAQAPLSEATSPGSIASSRVQAPAQLVTKQQPAYPPVTAPSRSELPPTAATPQYAPPPTRTAEAVARPIEPARVTIAAGERLAVRTIDAIDSGKVTDGQTLRASLEAPIVSHGQVIVPAGANVALEVTNVQGAGRIKGNSELSLRATSLEYRGRNYPISTSVFAEDGKARGKNTALKTGIGAGVGALIGGLAGGGKGAAIGAGAGGGAGFGLNALTHGQQVKIPSETVLNFQLESPLVVPAPR